ncbi:DUF6414 family protein [Enterococcus hulanensis]|uniref:DUF6414 family protein n=1 Tax=Enterococcus hulanensis TaxID=2559929 RepID=A0ABU3F1F1_9ENTE|nr:DUF6414 family protein [Enterococcus hulanensis]MDT2600950.1 DUF6414 family protein [Enterococcus hulanensis]MDT2611538.1 DUF6414 family protein [Enterococcus hulanensis]MDT2617977.1 DUF6414 family protein [Enterococcus hulanensis]MDT2628980.1 DUF6414 family protein [Enterococcus hulanensis]MDT2656542.1 DUF6414 family protein [Enterococcus hulanensis]
MNGISKIIYFDRETFQNSLEEHSGGYVRNQLVKEVDRRSAVFGKVESTIGLGIPFFERLKFLFSGNISQNYLRRKGSKVVVTSTEISDFKKIENSFLCFKNKRISDIKNSTTYFEAVFNHVNLLKNESEKNKCIEVFKKFREQFEGYDLYKIDDKNYVRFNQNAFISNIHRNELLMTEIDIYCIYVGLFKRDEFDFVKNIQSVFHLSNLELLEIFYQSEFENMVKDSNLKWSLETDLKEIKLYDVVSAKVSNNSIDTT